MDELPPNGKLVRDRIPEIIRSSGGSCHTDRLSEEQYLAALRNKLREEAEELIAAGDVEEIIDEIADVVEVVSALAAVHAIDCGDIDAAVTRKRSERGGFKERIWLRLDPTDERLP